MSNRRLNKDQIDHLARLAQLEIEKEEQTKYAKQLGEVLDYVASLQELELEGVEETNQVTDLENVTAEDKVGKCLARGKVLSQATETYQGYVKVKAIFGKEE